MLLYLVKEHTFFIAHRWRRAKSKIKRQGYAKKLVFSLPRPVELDTGSHISLGRVNIALCLHLRGDKKWRLYYYRLLVVYAFLMCYFLSL